MTKRELKGMAVKVRVNEDVLKRLDALAEKTGQTRSKVAADIIKYSLPAANRLEKYKVFEFALLFQKIYMKMFKKGNQPAVVRIPVGVWLEKSEVELLEHISKKLGMTRSKFAGNVIDANIPDAEFFQKVGITKAKRWFAELREGKHVIEPNDE